MNDEIYDRWLAERRDDAPTAGLTDQVMSRVARRERPSHAAWLLHRIHAIGRTRTARWGFCGGSLAIGSAPFLFLAHVARLLVF